MAIEREGVRSPCRAGTAISRHDERCDSSFIADMSHVLLIQGDRIFVFAIAPADFCSRQKLIGVVVAMNTSRERVGKPGENCQLGLHRLKRFHAIGEIELRSTTMREPGPFLVGGILRQRHGDTVRKIKTAETLWIGRSLVSERWPDE